MSRTDARQAFKKLGPNFMTPEAIAFRSTPSYFVELSHGTGFNDQTIYGVTVINRDGSRDGTYELGGMFYTIEEATEAFNAIER